MSCRECNRRGHGMMALKSRSEITRVLQATPDAVCSQRSVRSRGVYASYRFFGSPAARSGSRRDTGACTRSTPFESSAGTRSRRRCTSRRLTRCRRLTSPPSSSRRLSAHCAADCAAKHPRLISARPRRILAGEEAARRRRGARQVYGPRRPRTAHHTQARPQVTEPRLALKHGPDRVVLAGTGRRSHSRATRPASGRERRSDTWPGSIPPRGRT